jgi:hypothetical protein
MTALGNSYQQRVIIVGGKGHIIVADEALDGYKNAGGATNRHTYGLSHTACFFVLCLGLDDCN